MPAKNNIHKGRVSKTRKNIYVIFRSSWLAGVKIMEQLINHIYGKKLNCQNQNPNKLNVTFQTNVFVK